MQVLFSVHFYNSLFLLGFINYQFPQIRNKNWCLSTSSLEHFCATRSNTRGCHKAVPRCLPRVWTPRVKTQIMLCKKLSDLGWFTSLNSPEDEKKLKHIVPNSLSPPPAHGGIWKFRRMAVPCALCRGTRNHSAAQAGSHAAWRAKPKAENRQLVSLNSSTPMSRKEVGNRPLPAG